MGAKGKKLRKSEEDGKERRISGIWGIWRSLEEFGDCWREFGGTGRNLEEILEELEEFGGIRRKIESNNEAPK